MPTAASRPRVSGSTASSGSSWTTVATELEERRVAGRDRVHVLAGDVYEVHGRPVLRTVQRIHAVVLPGALDRGPEVAVLHEAAEEQGVAVRARAQDVISVRHRPLVAWREEQIPAAPAGVRAGPTQVGHPAAPEVAHQTEHVRRQLDDKRPGLGVQPGPAVHGLGVRQEVERAGIRERLGHQQGLIRRSEAQVAVPHRAHVRRGQRGEVGLHAALEVQVVVDLLDCRFVREAVEEAQRPQPCLDAVRRQDRCGDVRGHLESLLHLSSLRLICPRRLCLARSPRRSCCTYRLAFSLREQRPPPSLHRELGVHPLEQGDPALSDVLRDALAGLRLDLIAQGLQDLERRLDVAAVVGRSRRLELGQ